MPRVRLICLEQIRTDECLAPSLRGARHTMCRAIPSQTLTHDTIPLGSTDRQAGCAPAFPALPPSMAVGQPFCTA
jgi:hypothetical protein